MRDGYGPIIGYNQKDLIRPLKWDSDTQTLVSNNIYRDGTVGLGQFDLNEYAERFGCVLIKKSEDFQNLFIYLDRPEGSKENNWSLFVLYPENYKCSPPRHEIEAVLEDKLKDVKKWNAYAESDEAKENYRIFQKEQESKPPIDQCDGKQMLGYVQSAIDTGTGVLNISNNEAWGGGATGLALSSSTMGDYNYSVVSMREHDLYLARSGCKSLKDGPTPAMLSRLKQIDFKIQALIRSQYNQPGLITNGFGGVK